MRILVTGSRAWENNLANRLMFMAAMAFAIRGYESNNIELVVGDCPTGLDLIAREWAEDIGLPHRVFKADWEGRGRAAGPLRNQEMVDYVSDVPVAIAIGFPLHGEANRGTLDCMRRAERDGVRTVSWTTALKLN